jgi:hypothetical protein
MVTEAGVASAWIVSLTECVSLGDGTAKLARTQQRAYQTKNESQAEVRAEEAAVGSEIR